MPSPIENPLPHELQERHGIFLPPNVSMRILFLTHYAYEDVGDFSDFRRQIRESDIVIPELPGGDFKTIRFYQKIADGDYKTYENAKQYCRQYGQGFELAEYEALYNSQVKISHVDLPEGHELDKELIKIVYTSDFFLDTFQEELSAIDQLLAERQRLQRLREDYILSRLGSVLDETIQNRQKLKRKSKVNVLMIIGAEHTRIFDILNASIPSTIDEGVPSISYEVRVGPRFEYTGIALRESYDPARKITDEQRQQLIAEHIAFALISNVNTDVKGSLPIYNVVKKLTFGEIIELYEETTIINGEIISINYDSEIWRRVGGYLIEEKSKKQTSS